MKPTIYCHRGWWDNPNEQNTLQAFSKALDAGLGIELDVRDARAAGNGVPMLVVSHDPPEGRNLLWFGEVVHMVGRRKNPIAVNVKSCGLAPMFERLSLPPNYFFFDMSIPDMWHYHALKLPYRIRQSLAEPVVIDNPLCEDAIGSWLDTDVVNLNASGGAVIRDDIVLVSPELRQYDPHRSTHEYAWKCIRGQKQASKVGLCTDLPEQAMEFFS